ncbi:hypothetical protein [Massilia sp. TWP1-3-3]|uniref:hypothetical protein n=1 Tax=Massilia sp. TWP1-3-3 TaxID=2804573 RepID=UPI003CED5079
MSEFGIPSEFNSPPWGEGRERLTARERQRLIWLLGACLAADTTLLLLVSQAFA